MTDKKTVLVVEDEEDILALLHFNLVKAGYQVECASDGEEGLRKIAEKQPDLILLDLMLPGIGGLDICRQLRLEEATAKLPIIMLTARGEEADVVQGLELGADDYMTKPFSIKVLLARIQTVLRRNSEEDIVKPGEEIVCGELQIHPGRNTVKVAGDNVDLTYTEFRVLVALASRPGWVFTRYQIVNAVRGEDYAVTDRAVDVQIAGLRKKLGVCGSYIETVRGVGYRFREAAI
ncbi:two component transcriptional regulator, winged helix family [Malonomonas rubra DSM 5091]|uniref:Two component transcriptional regulator, winged helix family n=1 Tax=Malonomonas rubra DSM 5091 TaxID=1122189 RepID=A0A1M6H623_MALRU|nr:response regulator transcription factor [Malonomonas rubra]SHJ17592.1 two component transcriptional regulator, winged helix family [Malonomonas rubra DSM 5091]